MKQFLKKILVLIIILGVLAVGWVVVRSYSRGKAKDKVVFKTEEIVRGDVIRSISATGTVEPEELVNVGAQVNGKIMSFGKDADGNPVDFSSRVTTGMVLAQIDDVPYKADLQDAEATHERAKAGIVQAEAGIESAEASLKQSETRLALAKANWDRAQTLFQSKTMTRSDYDSYQSDYNTAQAEIAVKKAALAEAKASLSSAKGTLSSAEASLLRAKRNLDYCTITAPMDGVVIDRRVSIGQTVVSNQAASSIFLVAKDFAKMQVWVSVNEADIGSITPGMDVTFSCDAFPGVTFHGKVFRIRLNATLSSNVVTYIVEVNTDNDSGMLKPYLTANVKFIREARHEVLTVPASALRYTPNVQNIDPAALANPVQAGQDEALLWIKKGEGLLSPVKVKVGLNNGTLAEIITDNLKEGDIIVTGIDTSAAARGPEGPESGMQNNPFMPRMPRFSGRGSAGARERASQREAAAGASGAVTAPGAGGPPAGARPGAPRN